MRTVVNSRRLIFGPIGAPRALNLFMGRNATAYHTRDLTSFRAASAPSGSHGISVFGT